MDALSQAAPRETVITGDGPTDSETTEPAVVHLGRVTDEPTAPAAAPEIAGGGSSQAVPGDGSERDGGLATYLAKQAGRTAAWRARVDDLTERYRHRPLIDVGLRVYARDRESAGSVLGSALAFRLFLFFVPMLLFVVGLVGFVGRQIDESTVTDAGITGGLAVQINTALNQPNATRWSAVLLGFFGMATTGRTLSKVMVQVSCLTWRLPLRKASVKVVGGIIGLVVGIGIVSTFVNRIRHELGAGVTSVSFLAAFAVYAIVWLFVAMLLPRGTTDPGALLPGTLLNAIVLTGLQVVSQVYLPGRFERASTLYGAVGATVVILGWFFIVGRAVVLSMALNAALYERFGSVSTFVFRLPLVRALPHRWTWIRRFFQLDGPEPTAGNSAGTSDEAAD
jgi:uncharacterized BrkB/YihY/UPF0761 family membrane protein